MGGGGAGSGTDEPPWQLDAVPSHHDVAGVSASAWSDGAPSPRMPVPARVDSDGSPIRERPRGGLKRARAVRAYRARSADEGGEERWRRLEEYGLTTAKRRRKRRRDSSSDSNGSASYGGVAPSDQLSLRSAPVAPAAGCGVVTSEPGSPRSPPDEDSDNAQCAQMESDSSTRQKLRRHYAAGAAEGNAELSAGSACDTEPAVTGNDDSKAAGELGGEQLHGAYVDRIRPDVSTSMLRESIDNSLPPLGQPKVVALRVVRNRRTRHCEAHAWLRVPVGGVCTLPVCGVGEYIRVQHGQSADRVSPPCDPTPRSTLHVRLYARRREGGWSAWAQRMTWAGLLVMLESAAPGITGNIRLVADDMSKNGVHYSVLRCSFFAECGSAEVAEKVRNAIDDQRTRGLDDVPFLICADFTRREMRLHDKSAPGRERMERHFEGCQEEMKQIQEQPGMFGICDGVDCPLPESCERHRIAVHKMFSGFSRDRGTADSLSRASSVALSRQFGQGDEETSGDDEDATPSSPQGAVRKATRGGASGRRLERKRGRRRVRGAVAGAKEPCDDSNPPRSPGSAAPLKAKRRIPRRTSSRRAGAASAARRTTEWVAVMAEQSADAPTMLTAERAGPPAQAAP